MRGGGGRCRVGAAMVAATEEVIAAAAVLLSRVLNLARVAAAAHAAQK